MLGHEKLMAFVAARDLDQARAFYRDILGLQLVSEDRMALVFDAAGTTLRVAAVPDMMGAKYTVLGWQVGDIAQTVAKLAEAGVHLERYAGMTQDEAGIWKSPIGARVAWFKDPDGNTLSITQF